MKQRIATGVALVVLTGSGIAAQEAGRSEYVLRGDMLEVSEVDGVSTTTVTGNVRLRQGDAFLTSRRAVGRRATIRFTGDVVLVDETDTLRAPLVVYDTLAKVGVAPEGLVLSDGTVRVQAPQGRYHVPDKRARFDSTVTLTDSTSVLQSLRGTYDARNRVAVFSGEVSMTQADTQIGCRLDAI